MECRGPGGRGSGPARPRRTPRGAHVVQLRSPYETRGDRTAEIRMTVYWRGARFWDTAEAAATRWVLVVDGPLVGHGGGWLRSLVSREPPSAANGGSASGASATRPRATGLCVRAGRRSGTRSGFGCRSSRWRRQGRGRSGERRHGTVGCAGRMACAGRGRSRVLRPPRWHRPADRRTVPAIAGCIACHHRSPGSIAPSGGTTPGGSQAPGRGSPET